MENSHILRFIESFTRLLAHGLKNRLTPAVTAVYMLEEDAALEPERLKTLTGITLRSLQSALDVLTSLEEFSKIAPGKALPTEITAWLQELAKRYRVEVEVTGDPVTVGLDRALWESVISELLLNVKKHGAGKAAIRYRLEQSGGVDRLTVKITDFGPGFTKMTADKALETTRKGETSTGSGMGLSKALWAAVILDGNIEMSGSTGGGVVVEATGRTA